MHPFHLSPVLAFGTAALVLSATNIAGTAATRPVLPAHGSAASVTSLRDSDTMDSGTAAPVRPTILTDLVVQVTGLQTPGLLSSQQKAQLTQLPIPIVVPTFLPAGFRLVQAEGGTSKYANGDDDSGYAIDYQGENNTCLSVRSSKDGPRRLPRIKQVQTRLGLMTIYLEQYRDIKSLVTFLGIKGNPVLSSGGTLPDSTADGGFKRCRAVSIETYTQVLKSLVVVK